MSMEIFIIHGDNSVPELDVYVLEGIKFRHILTADTLCTQVKVSQLTEPFEEK